MKIVIAPNALKGSLTAREAAEAMHRGVLAACPSARTTLVPVSDGGDGLILVLHEALGGELRTTGVHGPLGEEVRAEWLFVPERGLAVIEMARASGLVLVPPERLDPLRANTLGTGELIRAALDAGAKTLLLGLGGSATIDGGMGMAAALGIRFLDEKGSELEPGGKALERVAVLDVSRADERLKRVEVVGLRDVSSPLLGPEGAAAVYGPQKGASPAVVRRIEAGLETLADLIASTLGVDVRSLDGAGAAGGLGAGVVAFLGGSLEPGIEVVLELTGCVREMADADLALTAEGALDEQTAHGKAPAGVAALAKRHGVPCLALAGSVARERRALHEVGITAALSLCPGPLTLEEAVAEAARFLEASTEEALRLFAAGRDTQVSRRG